MPRTRLSASLYLILVFASGILVGVVSHRLYVTTSASASNSPQTMAEYRKRYLAEMRARVKVSDAQVAAVVGHLDDAKKRFDNLHAEEQPLHDKIQNDLIDEIRAELSDQQKIAYDTWRAEREKARQAAPQQQPPQR